jgi:hypothetical protein
MLRSGKWWMNLFKVWTREPFIIPPIGSGTEQMDHFPGLLKLTGGFSMQFITFSIPRGGGE